MPRSYPSSSLEIGLERVLLRILATDESLLRVTRRFWSKACIDIVDGPSTEIHGCANDIFERLSVPLPAGAFVLVVL